MQTQSYEKKLIDLSHSSIVLNESNDFTSSIQSFSTTSIPDPKNLQSQTQGQYHLLTISYDFIQLASLTALKPQVTVFGLEVPGQFQLKSQLKLSKLFQLDTLSYFMELQIVLVKEKVTEVGYTTVKTQDLITYLKHHVQVNFYSKQPFHSEESCQCLLSLGKKLTKSDKNWSFGIQNFKIITKTSQTEPYFPNQQQKPIIKNLSLPQDYSYPLIDKLQLPISQQNTNLQQKISQLQPYSSPKLSKNSSQQFFISHDMKGGYIQDLNTFSPFRSGNQTHHYRFNYLSQTKIFNYFSHYPISIPPQMWRSLCRKYDVLCLGTFIVEPNHLAIDQRDFMTEEFALKLIYIAKKAQFDGYLINIQVPIQNPAKLISWLDFLTKQINQSIPGSQIVWYDSVVINGQLAYQNQLNPYNKAFYQVSNGIFTNYWWKQESLINCLKNKIPSKEIYIGNDCFGRNTYGGGKYQILNAVKKIQQIGKGQLIPALFAPGYTYEDDGQVTRQKFNQNQIKMYHGSNIDERKIEKWKVTQNGGQGWKKEDDWFVTSYQLCKRQALVKICEYKSNSGALTIKFSCFVAGTGPKYPDYFKIVLQLIDYKTNAVLLENVCPSTAAQQKQQYIEIKLEIDCGLLTENICARILQEGKDSQHWAGHYGSRFKGETVALILSNDKRKWISSLPITPTPLYSRYTTFFNKGQGDNFYLFGSKGLPKYSSLSDFDIPPVLTLNNISTVEITYADSYIGGTCLKFQNTDKIRINNFNVPTGLSEGRIFTVLIVTKGTKPQEIICGTAKGSFKEYVYENTNSQNGWIPYIAEIPFQKQESNFTAEVKFLNNNGFIGEFSMFEQKNLKEKQPQSKLQLTITLNKQSKPSIPYHFDIIIQSNPSVAKPNSSTKILVKFGQFSRFINTQQIASQKEIETQYRIFGLLRNIPAVFDKDDEIGLKLLDISTGVQPKILAQKLFSKQQIKHLLQRNSLKMDFNL